LHSHWKTGQKVLKRLTFLTVSKARTSSHFCIFRQVHVHDVDCKRWDIGSILFF